jgi:hypothetical protein
MHFFEIKPYTFFKYGKHVYKKVMVTNERGNEYWGLRVSGYTNKTVRFPDSTDVFQL